MGHLIPYIDFYREYLWGSLDIIIFLEIFILFCKKKLCFMNFFRRVNHFNDTFKLHVLIL